MAAVEVAVYPFIPSDHRRVFAHGLTQAAFRAPTATVLTSGRVTFAWLDVSGGPRQPSLTGRLPPIADKQAGGAPWEERGEDRVGHDKPNFLELPDRTGQAGESIDSA